MRRSPFRVPRATQHPPLLGLAGEHARRELRRRRARPTRTPGLDGIGIWELKLGDGSTSRRSSCSPRAGSARRRRGADRALDPAAAPAAGPRRSGASGSPRYCARSAAWRRSGPRRSCASPVPRRPGAGRGARIVVPACARSRREAEQAGLRIALEPYQREGIESWSLISTSREAVELIEEVGSAGGRDPVRRLASLEHADLLDEIERARAPVRRRARQRLARADARLGRSRAARRRSRGRPRRSSARSTALGWNGFYDLEVFSDNGALGRRIPTRSGISTQPSSPGAEASRLSGVHGLNRRVPG